jgi:chemotaxis protein CheX
LDTILLVDDSAALAEVLTAHCRQAGRQALVVSSALAAYEALLRTDIQLVVTALSLPDRDGLEMVKVLRSRRDYRGLPIVALAVDTGAETTRRCQEAGVDLVLSKASATSEVLAAMDQMVGQAKALPASGTLDRDLGRCIVKATADVFRTMMNLTVHAGAVAVEKARSRKAEVIGSIGVAGFLSGSISVFLPKSIARQAVAAMLMLDSPEEVGDADLPDAIGELINMIGGGIKTELFQKAPLFDISVPSVYVGDDLQRRTVTDDLCFHVPFQLGDQEFAVEFLMATKKAGGTGVQASLLGSMQKA